MTRTFFRTSLVHHCHSPELGYRKPEKCRCRKFISRAQARDLVDYGAATWLMDYSGSEPAPTWNVVLFGRTLKTPRAHTIERAHIERALEASDNGEMMQRMDRMLDGSEEDIALFDSYYNLEIENRLRMFPWPCGPELREMKEYSDSLGVLTGQSGKSVHDMLIRKTDKMKDDRYFHEEFEKGRPVLLRIGMDERSTFSKEMPIGNDNNRPHA